MNFDYGRTLTNVLIAFIISAIFIVILTNAEPEVDATTIELRADANAHLVLKRRLPSFESFTGSFEFLNDRSVPASALLVATDADSGLTIAKCLFNNRPFSNQNNVRSQQGSRWLRFDWTINNGLMWCNTPESQTIFKLDAPNTKTRPKAYSVEIAHENPSLCLRALRVPDSTPLAFCPLNVSAFDVVENVSCGCSTLNNNDMRALSDRHEDDSGTAAADFLTANDIFAPHNMNNDESANLSSDLTGDHATSESMPNPIAFPMFRPSLGTGAAASVDSSQADNNMPIFDHLKVSPLFANTSKTPETMSTEATNLTQNKENGMTFTAAPEVWIRATRPPFHHNKPSRPQVVLQQHAAVDANFPSTTPPPSVSDSALDISDLNGTNARASQLTANAAVDAMPAARASTCKPRCEMGTNCVVKVSQQTGTLETKCDCPPGLLGRNCNIRNPCANASICMEHYGPGAQCIIDEEGMAEKAPSIFLEAPHICMCHDDNNDWKECGELFRMEFGGDGALPHESTLVINTSRLKPADQIDSSTPSEPMPEQGEQKLVDELGVFNMHESLRLSGKNSVADNSTRSNDTTKSFNGPQQETQRRNEVQTEKAESGSFNEKSSMKSISIESKSTAPEIIPRLPFPIHRNNISMGASIDEPAEKDSESESSSSSAGSSSPASSSSELVESSAAKVAASNEAPSFKRITDFESLFGPKEESHSTQSSTIPTVIHLTRLSTQFTIPPGIMIHVPTKIDESSLLTDAVGASPGPELTGFPPKTPIAIALPMPTANNESIFVDSPTSKTELSSNTIGFETSEKLMSTTAQAKSTDSEGDNGFERITQHINELNHVTDLPPEQPEDSPTLPARAAFPPNQEHGGAFEPIQPTIANNNTMVVVPEAEMEREEEEEQHDRLPSFTSSVSTSGKGTEKGVGMNTVDEHQQPSSVDDHENEDQWRNEKRFRTGGESQSRSSLQSSAAFWIIGVGILGVFLILLASGGACVGRYVRRSRRLHGKYNPSREESVLATNYAMPMTSVSYLAYCPQPTDGDEFTFCCTYYYLGKDKPSCCRFPIHTGLLITGFIGIVVILAVLILLSCWCCACCPIAEQMSKARTTRL